jgi:cytidylate kinase
MTIAIDGYASTGKSTLAKMLARHYGLTFVDSGALYRGITLFALEQGFFQKNNNTEKLLQDALKSIDIGFDYRNGALILNGNAIDQKIRNQKVSENVSEIASFSFVREFLLQKLRTLKAPKGLVMDGRDIGTVVFPDADFKFFFTAQPQVRAQRRWKELKEKGHSTTYEEILENLLLRDQTDSQRVTAPLRKATDAVEIDTSNKTQEEVFSFLTSIIEGK